MTAVGRRLIYAGLFFAALGLAGTPHDWIGAGVTFVAFVAAVFFYASSLLPLPKWVGGRFRTADARHGIVSLQFAGDADRVRSIVASWREVSERSKPRRNVLEEVTTSVGKDFVLIAAYTVGLACALTWSLGVLREHPGWGWSWLRSSPFVLSLGALVLLAAILDVIENLFILRMLAGAVIDDALPAWTRAIALVKFAVIAPAAAYAGLGLFAAIFKPG